MKTYKHLWENLVTEDNVINAILNASKGNMKRKKLDEMKNNPEKYVSTVQKWITYFVPIKHTPKIINDGISAKKREIIVPTVKEHIVQHAVMNVLKPIFMHGMYEHSYASVPQRGCHKGARTVEKWIKHGGKNIKYCLKMDIKKYFDSISQDILINKLSKKIRDERFLKLLMNIISITPHGLPLGFYTSQWFANFYLQDFDHFVKEKLGVKYYIRYMDDIVIFHSNKRELHRIFDEISRYLKDELSLAVKGNWQIFRFHTKQNKGRFLDFMGFRFYRNKTTLRWKILLKATRKARRIKKKSRATIHDARQMLTYIGWIDFTNCYSYYCKHIKSCINIRSLKKIISNHDRRRNLCGINQSQTLNRS